MSLWEKLFGAKRSPKGKIDKKETASSNLQSPLSQTAPEKIVESEVAPAPVDPVVSFYEAVERGDLETIKAQLKDNPDFVLAKDKDGNLPLHRAAEKDDMEIAAFLIDQGAEVNARGKFGCIPLHYAASQAMAALLVDHGAQVNTKSRANVTPLHRAAEERRRTVAEFLLAHGAQVNVGDIDGWTPLHWAVERNHKAMVELLLTHGADINAKSGGGDTPLRLAKKWTDRKEVEEVLLAHGVKAADRSGPGPLANLLQATQDGTILKEIEYEFDKATLQVGLEYQRNGLTKNEGDTTGKLAEEMWVKAYTLVADKLRVKYGLTAEEFGKLFKKAKNIE